MGLVAESEEALKLTKRLRIKTDIVRLQFMRYFKNFVCMSEKRHIKTGSAFLSRFVCSSYNRFKKFICSSECDQKRKQDFAKRDRA